MQAHAVARPVLARLEGGPGRARVLGAGRSAAYLDMEGFVVAITARGVALMPNGIALVEREPRWPRAGTRLRIRPGRIESGHESVGGGAGAWTLTWPIADPPRWDPTLPPIVDPAGLARRARAILRARDGRRPDGARNARIDSASHIARGLDPATLPGLGALIDAVRSRDPAEAARAAPLLCGRGPGLTPEGDDLLAAGAATVAASALACGWTPAARRGWLDAILAGDVRARTTALSATLLELAMGGMAVEPLHGLLDLTPGGTARWAAALERLERIGHSTGPAYATASALAALALATPPRGRARPRNTAPTAALPAGAERHIGSQPTRIPSSP